MKLKRSYTYLLVIVAMGSGCAKFLDKGTPDRFADTNFWTSENNVRTYCWSFYNMFTGFGTSASGDFYFSTFNDDQANTAFQIYPVSAAATNGNWNYDDVRKANVLLNRIDKVPMTDEAKNHWRSVARFFRAFDYFNKVKIFGDVPWYGQALDVADTAQLYKPRDSRVLVMDSIMADLDFAIANLRPKSAEVNAVNKDVALALKSRVGLYEGTFRKYHDSLALPDANKFLTAAVTAADLLMTGVYKLGDYKGLYSSMDLGTNTEVILYKKYILGQLTHSVIGYTNSTTRMHGPTKSAVESYLLSDGLPIKLSPLYQGDATIQKLRANRDKRLLVTIDTFLTYNGSVVGGLNSSTGYRPAKFLQPASQQLAPQNETDAPIFWLAEVLLNYAEAKAELGSLTQADLDKSINLLRARGGVAALQVVGTTGTAIAGNAFVDPAKDATVSSLIWEIRRERRVELMMDGFRGDDLVRWKKGAYLSTASNPDIMLGAKVPANSSITLNADGYLIIYPASSKREFLLRNYFSAIPTGQISLYPQGVLKQNYGW